MDQVELKPFEQQLVAVMDRNVGNTLTPELANGLLFEIRKIMTQEMGDNGAKSNDTGASQ